MMINRTCFKGWNLGVLDGLRSNESLTGCLLQLTENGSPVSSQRFYLTELRFMIEESSRASSNSLAISVAIIILVLIEQPLTAPYSLACLNSTNRPLVSSNYFKGFFRLFFLAKILDNAIIFRHQITYQFVKTAVRASYWANSVTLRISEQWSIRIGWILLYWRRLSSTFISCSRIPRSCRLTWNSTC